MTTPARKKFRQDMEDRAVKVARRRLHLEIQEQVEVEVEEQNVDNSMEQSSTETLRESQNTAQKTSHQLSTCQNVLTKRLFQVFLFFTESAHWANLV